MIYCLHHPANHTRATAQSLLAQSNQGRHRLVYTVANVDEAYAVLMQQGIQSAWSPRGEQSNRNCAILDDNGLTVELISELKTPPPSLPQKGRNSTSLPLRGTEGGLSTPSPSPGYNFHHVNILTDNWRRTRDFYTKIFGLRVVMEYVDDNDGAFVFLADAFVDYTNHNILLEITGPPYGEQREADYFAEHGAGIDHICYTSTDIDGAYQNLVAAGASPITPPYDAWGTRLAWVKDLNGRDIELMLPPSPEDFD